MAEAKLQIARDPVGRTGAHQPNVGALPRTSNRESHLLELLATRRKQTKDAMSNREFIARFASGADYRSRRPDSCPENGVARPERFELPTLCSEGRFLASTLCYTIVDKH